MATQRVPPATASDTEPIDTSRYECIDGELVERPLPGDRHAEVQENVRDLIKPLAKVLGMKIHLEWTLDETDRPKHDWMTPDVLISMPGPYQRSRIGHLLPPAFLAVEVLSPGQTVTQMAAKAWRYHAWGVQHVWLIEPEENYAVVMERDRPGGFMLFQDGILEAGELRVSMADVLHHED